MIIQKINKPSLILADQAFILLAFC
ncbi:hypothetical protein FGG59_gp022 [Escherichia phage H8]|nr:hypothetical protein FGG59_gp022 [Escherichia phage H8]